MILIIISSAAWKYFRFSFAWPLALSGGLIILYMCGIKYFITPGKIYKEDASKENLKIEFDDEKVSFITKTAESFVKWENYKKAWDYKSFFFLFSYDNQPIMISKRIFTEENILVFKRLLERKVPKLEVFK